MSFKNLRRIVCATVCAGVFAAIPAMSGCTIQTEHPEAKITISFNDVEYVLEYKMYRNMYPQTVLHFIELAENNFYDNTIIHDYESSYWYGGGYGYTEEYDQDFEDGAMDDYLTNTSKASEYYNDLFLGGKLTPSVYLDYIAGDYKQPLSTLIGEFSNNQHIIEKNALASSFGCLSMYYSDKSDTVKHVYLDKEGTDDELLGDYNYNSATSLFRIQVSSSTSEISSYCIFAVLKDTDVLDDLRSDISTYISDNSLSGKFTQNATVTLYDYDVKTETQDTYTLPYLPLIIKKVEITKY